MTLAIPAVFFATVPAFNPVEDWDHMVLTPKGEWTDTQYGDDAPCDSSGQPKQPQYRFYRWLTAWQDTCRAYGLPVWSRYVPCNRCGGAVDAWQAHVDHLVSRFNGGRSSGGNLALIHAGCNIAKSNTNELAHKVNAFRKAHKECQWWKGMRNAKGGIRAQILQEIWDRYPRIHNGWYS